jgi:ABC-type lipopolysaccharide export system ATPase subunit
MQAYSKSVRFDSISIYDAFKRADLLTYLPQFNFIPSHLCLKRIFLDFNISFTEFGDEFEEFRCLAKTRIGKLSGGLRRLVEVYIIIKSPAQFSMLDEPFTHIMPLHVERIKELLMHEKSKKGFIITDHMYRHLIDICDRSYLLLEGKTHLVRSVEDIERLGYARI